MLTIDRVVPEQNQYLTTCDFVHAQYVQAYRSNTHHYPDMFFTACDKNQVVGCIGLNTRLRIPLFLNDKRLTNFKNEVSPDARLVDQAYFALDKHSVLLPTLIVLMVAYAEYMGVRWVACAGIDVTLRTFEKLNLDVIKLGQTDISIVPKPMQKHLKAWHKEKEPVTCLLSTAGVREKCSKVLERHRCRVKLSDTLSNKLYQKELEALEI